MNKQAMKNTRENKAKYFAQHYGQKLMVNYPNRSISGNDLLNVRNSDEVFHLELTPLSEITDEDAVELGYQDAEHFKAQNKLKEFPVGTFFTSKEADYLRSCKTPYAIPYNGLSVEELIEYGWLKLKKK